MLYHLFYSLRYAVSGFNVVRYITFRTAVASLTALFLVLVLGPWMIERLRRLQVGQYIREEGPQAHHSKKGTPTMGGLLILTGIIVPTLLWADLTNRNVWILVLSTLGFGAIGFADDYLKVVKKRNLGLSGRAKLIGQFTIGLAVGIATYVFSWSEPTHFSTRLIFPFFKSFTPDLGMAYVLFAALVLVFASNAVNLTDGLDGLAIGPVVINAGTFLIFAYVAGSATILAVPGGSANLAEYFRVAHVPLSAELAVYCAAMMGAGIGFLWYNTYPAQVFMGDVGSLSLGGGIGMLAVLTKNELTLIIVGGLFVWEGLSVIIQVGSFKLRGKRVFKMAPIHHHYELKGWAEPKIIVRFWIISILLGLVALGTLKVR
jgi:phospho-N-acetylmuramoyl-pentapeptide-transferase